MRSALALLLVTLVSCGSTPVEPEPPPGRYRVLFVGNSLTYTNDLPAMVRAIAQANGDTFTTKSLAFPDWGLEDHWVKGSAPAEITDEVWDLVVMQQGPSSLAASRLDLLAWSRKFGDLARRHHTCPAMYMVWPAKAYGASFDAVHAHYAEAADSIDGLFLPAGDAWRKVWGRRPSLALYGPDDFHPSPLGSYVAALAIYSGITGRSPVGNPATVPGVDLDDATRTEIQRAVWEATDELPRRCGP